MNDEPVTFARTSDAPERSVFVSVEFVNVAPVKTAFVMVAPVNVVPDIFVFAIEASMRFADVNVEFVNVAPVKTAFVIVALANVVPDIFVFAIEAPVRFADVNVEFVNVAPVKTAFVIVAPVNVVPEMSAFESVTPARFADVNVEFVNVAPVKSTFVIVAPANETPFMVVPDNKAPLISTLSNTRPLVMVEFCNVEPALATVTTHDTLDGASYNDDDACDAMIVAEPGPFSVTKPDDEFTVRTELSAGLLNAYDFVPALSLETAIVNGASVTFLVNVEDNPVSVVVPFLTVRTQFRLFCIEYCEFVFCCPVIVTVPTFVMVTFAMLEEVTTVTTPEISVENVLLTLLSLDINSWNGSSP
jgi:hypothetical protein